MPERILYDEHRFGDGLNNTTSVFGTAASQGRRGTRGHGRPAPRTGASAAFPQGDFFTVDASDPDTGVWIEPNSGGVLEAYPSTATTATLSTLTSVTAAAYGKHTDGTEKMVMYGKGSGNDQLLILSSAGAESTSLHTFASGASKRASIATYNNQFLICNGVDPPISIDIGDNTKVDPITESRPLVTSGAGMSLSAGDTAGNVRGKVVYYISEMTGSGDTLAESALSIRHANLTIDAGLNQDGQGDQITITFPNHSAYNSKNFRIYRSYPDLIAPNYLAQVAVGASGGTYVDNIKEEELGQVPYLNGDPPLSAFTSWTVHKGRMFALAGNTLYFSDPGSHTSWFTQTDGNSFDVHKDDGDVCTALARTDEGLVIFKENHIYLLLGENLDSFRLSDALSTVEGHSVGTPHTQSVVAVPGGLVFWWRNGVYALSGGQVTKLSWAVEGQWVDPTVNFPEDDAVSLGFDPRFQHVYVAFNYTTSGKPESSFIFDLNTSRWIGASQDAAGKCYLYDPGAAARAPVFYSLSANGLTKVRSLVKDKFSSTANTTEASRFTPAGSFSGRDPHTSKQWLWLEFFFTEGTAADNLTITPSIDGTNLTAVTQPLPTTPDRVRVSVAQRGYRLSYKVESALGQKPWGLYEVRVAYHEFAGDAP